MAIAAEAGRPPGANYGKRYDMSFSRAKDATRDKLLGYAAQYGPITARGLFYAVLAAGLIGKDDDEKIGRLVAKLRREGALDWDLVVDGSRQCHEPWTHRTVRDGVTAMLDVVRLDPWATKRETVIVLIEKDALTGVIEPATDRYAVPLYPVRGYNSLTKLREVALRIRNDGRPCTIYQLGDLDPSGDHATEEAREEIVGFAPDAPITFERLAINADQLNAMRIGEDGRLLSEFARPTNRKDPRLAGFEAKYGLGFPSFELDIIPPPTLREMVEAAILRHISADEIEAAERRARQQAGEIRRRLGL